MQKTPASVSFEMEVSAKLNQLIDWTIEHSPKDKHHLTYGDFSEMRTLFNKVACGLSPAKEGLKPEDGGAQYIAVTPAPWP